VKKKSVIIVGGGTAGLAIAENLKLKFDVTVLEKNTLRKTPIINRVPLLIGPLYRKKTLKYIQRTDIVAGEDRSIPFFESCVLGGASVINGCVHALGSRYIWNVELKRFAHNFDQVANLYAKIFTTNIYNFNKKIRLRLAAHNELDQYFFQSLEKKKFTETGLLTADLSGYGKVINTVGLILRSSVISLLGRRKLKILTGQNLIRIGKTKDNQFEVITRSDRFLTDYVILSSGVIGTNLLFLEKRIAGVDDNYLRNHYVGLSIKDHSNVRVNVRSSKSFGSLNEIAESFLKKFYLLAKHLLGLDTVLLGTGATSGIQLDLDGDGLVDTRIHLLQFSETGRHKSDGKDFCSGAGFSLSISPIQTVSSGKIVVDEFGAPTIDPGYFTEQLDLDRMKLALAFCLDLLKSDPLKEFVEEIEDYELIKSDAEAYIRDTFFSGHHLIGGCSNVIDGNFEVKGYSGLYVCDASVFSEFVSSNIHAPVILLAMLFSEKFIARIDRNSEGGENARL
jgi:hypothetical protein